MLNSCWLSGLDLQRRDIAQVVQCWPPESGTDLSEVEIICLCIDLASFMDLYFKIWSLCGDRVGCGIGPWCKEGENLKKNSQQFVFDCKERDNPKKILNKLFFIAKKETTPRRLSTTCF